MAEQTSIQTNLVMYTKEYSTEQLLRSVRQPMTQYFKFLYEVARQDSKKDKRNGPLKHLVKFQERVNMINDYEEPKLRQILRAFKQDKEFPLESLLKTILLANSIIIGSFGQQKLESHKIDIPTATTFIHTLLKNAGQVYYTSPEQALRINHASLDFDVCEDAVQRTIQQLLPFEKLIKPIKEQGNFKAVPSQAPQFAQEFIQHAGEFDNNEIKRIALQNVQRTQEPAMERESNFGPEAYRMARDDVDMYSNFRDQDEMSEDEIEQGNASDEYGFLDEEEEQA